MILYLEKLCKDAQTQCNESHFADGHLSVITRDRQVYVNVTPKQLAALRTNPGLIDKFERYERCSSVSDAIRNDSSIEYKDQRHIVLEIIVGDSDKRAKRIIGSMIKNKGYRRVF